MQPRGETGTADMSIVDEEYGDPEDMHPPVTPPRTAERLFGLGDIDTQNISAAVLAETLRGNNQKSVASSLPHNTMSVTTNNTDGGFYTAQEPSTNPFDIGRIVNRVVEIVTPPRRPLPSDILTTSLASNTIPDDLSTDSFDVDEQEEDTVLHTNTAQESDPESRKEESMSSTPASAETMHIDAAEKVYDTAKNVWGWGKGVVIFSPFLSLAETVASKVVNVATGETLESLDTKIVDKVHGMDDAIFNPAIAFIVATILQAAGKSEETLKPIIIKILTPFGLLKTTAENPEVTTVSGVTVTPAE